mmetsp:Transcript_36080/g.102140  ORF Transcript_36080/g.102140 Transcript_36080/m.102140 type:complete len:358 (-) Transcript_36080:690-1763(-)
MTKEKSKGRAAHPAKRSASTALEAYGEGFMSMFEDAEDVSRMAAKRRTVGGGEPRKPSAGQRGGNAKPGVGQRERKPKVAAGPGGEANNKAGNNRSGHGDGAGGRREARGARDVMADIFGRAALAGTGNRSAARGGGESSGGSLRPAAGSGSRAEVVAFVDPTRRSAAEKAAEKERMAVERRQFMSCKVSKVHESTVADGSTTSGLEPQRQQAEEDLLSPEGFQQMQKEAEELGAAALDKKGQKAFRQRQLLAIGAKIEKGPRMAAMIGKGMAKKQSVRSARALEDAIEAGMVQRKALGKKKMREKAAAAVKERNPGLGDPMGSKFRNGTLHVGPVGPRKRGKAPARKQSFLKGIKL